MRFPQILLTTALIAFSGAAAAQHWHGDHQSEGMLFRGLNLTEAQKTQLKTIEQAGWTQAKPTMDQLHAVQEQIMTRMLSPGSVSEADLAPLQTQSESLRTQLDQVRLSHELQMRQVLTPAQLAEAASKQQQLASLHEQERQVTQPTGAN